MNEDSEVDKDLNPEFEKLMSEHRVSRLDELQQDLSAALKNEFGSERLKCLILTILAEFETLNRNMELNEDERQ